jgi:hypothetical protein
MGLGRRSGPNVGSGRVISGRVGHSGRHRGLSSPDSENIDGYPTTTTSSTTTSTSTTSTTVTNTTTTATVTTTTAPGEQAYTPFTVGRASSPTGTRNGMVLDGSSVTLIGTENVLFSRLEFYREWNGIAVGRSDVSLSAKEGMSPGDLFAKGAVMQNNVLTLHAAPAPVIGENPNNCMTLNDINAQGIVGTAFMFDGVSATSSDGIINVGTVVDNLTRVVNPDNKSICFHGIGGSQGKTIVGFSWGGGAEQGLICDLDTPTVQTLVSIDELTGLFFLAVNNNDVVAGSIIGLDGYKGAVYQDGELTLVSGSESNPQLWFTDIEDDTDTIVGYASPADWSTLIGAIYQNGVLTEVQAPEGWSHVAFKHVKNGIIYGNVASEDWGTTKMCVYKDGEFTVFDSPDGVNFPLVEPNPEHSI